MINVDNEIIKPFLKFLEGSNLAPDLKNKFDIFCTALPNAFPEGYRYSGDFNSRARIFNGVYRTINFHFTSEEQEENKKIFDDLISRVETAFQRIHENEKHDGPNDVSSLENRFACLNLQAKHLGPSHDSTLLKHWAGNVLTACDRDPLREENSSFVSENSTCTTQSYLSDESFNPLLDLYGQAGPEFLSRLIDLGLSYIEIKGDGHCGFRALATWLMRFNKLTLDQVDAAFKIIRECQSLKVYIAEGELSNLQRIICSAIDVNRRTKLFESKNLCEKGYQDALIRFLRYLSVSLILSEVSNCAPDALLDGKKEDEFVFDTIREDGDPSSYATFLHLHHLNKFFTSNSCCILDVVPIILPFKHVVEFLRSYVDSDKNRVELLQKAVKELEDCDLRYQPISLLVRQVSEATSEEEIQSILADADHILHIIEQLGSIQRKLEDGLVGDYGADDADEILRKCQNMIVSFPEHIDEKISIAIAPMLAQLNTLLHSNDGKMLDLQKLNDIHRLLQEVLRLSKEKPPLLSSYLNEAQRFAQHLEVIAEKKRQERIDRSIAELRVFVGGDSAKNQCMLLRVDDHYDLLVPNKPR